MPTAWKENEIIAYSETGYQNRTWQLQREWNAQSADVFTVSKEGLIPLQSNVDTSNGTITLSISPKQMITIVPAGSLEVKDLPDAPQNVSATRCNNNLVKIGWQGDDDVPCQYKVLRKASDETEYRQIGITKENSFDDTGISPKTAGKTYEYIIRAESLFSGKSSDSQAGKIDHEIYLSDLEWQEVELDSNQPWAIPKKDKNIDNNSINMNGIYFMKGLSIHANGSVTYNLAGNYKSFKAFLGTDDYNVQKGKSTSVKCSVYVDGELKYQSGLINIRSMYSVLDIDVTNAQQLKLVVNNNDDGNDSDWSIWGSARLIA